MNDELSMGMLFMLRDQFSGPAAHVGSSMNTLHEKAKQVETSLTSTIEAMEGSLSLLSMATAGFSATMGPVKVAADFEHAMTRVGVMSAATAAELEMLNADAQRLGALTVFSASQVAAAQANLAVANLRPMQIMSAMPGVLGLAAASQIELALSAQITTDALAGFGLQADEAGRVADILAAVSTKAKAPVTGVGEALKYVGPVAKSFGIEIEQAVAAIGLMGNMGIRGEQAGTTLRGGLLNIARGGNSVTDSLTLMGVAHKDVLANMNSLPNLIALLEPGYRRLGDAERSVALANIFGTEAMSGFAGMMAQGSAALGTLSGELAKSKGRAAEMSGALLNDLSGDMESLKGTIEGVAIAIGLKMLPVLRPLVSWIITVLNAMMEWVNAHPMLVRNAMILVTAVSAFMVALLSVRIATWNFSTTLKLVAPLLGKLRLGMLESAAATGTLRGGLMSVGLPLAKIMILMGALTWAWKNDFGGMRTSLTAWWNDNSLVFDAVGELLRSTKDGVGSLSAETAAKLSERGLLGKVRGLYTALFRLSEVVAGFAEGMERTGKILLVVGEYLVQLTGSSTKAKDEMGALGMTSDPKKWRAIGDAIGTIVIATLAWSYAVKGLSVVLTVLKGIRWAYAATSAAVLGFGNSTLVVGAYVYGSNAATAIATAAQWAYNAALYACPYVWIVAAILAVIAALVLLIVYYDEVTAWLGSWTGGWVDAGDVILYLLLGPLGLMIIFIRKIYQHWDQIKALLGTVWDSIASGVIWLVDLYVSIWAGFFGFFLDAWDSIGGTVLGVMSNLLIALLNVVTNPIRQMLGLINAIPASVLPAMAVELRTKVNAFLEEGVGGVALSSTDGGSPSFKAKAPGALGGGASEAVTSRAVAGETAAAARGAQPLAVTVTAPKTPTVIKTETVLQVDGREMARSVSEHMEGAQARGLATP